MSSNGIRVMISGQGFYQGHPGTIEGPNLSRLTFVYPVSACCSFIVTQPKNGLKEHFPLRESKSQSTHILSASAPWVSLFNLPASLPAFV